jgi:uncharacterized protein
MQKDISLKLKPAEALDDNTIKAYLSNALAIPSSEISGFYRSKQSIDARSRSQVWINLVVRVFVNEPFVERPFSPISFPDVQNAKKKIIIIGAGPAGLFAAIQLIELGIQPIILERGKDVRARRRDLAAMNKQGVVNEESNYCFGEGGAGTYSDGKLYTRSSKRGDINRVLQLLHQFGADENVLYEAHPHIGTNKLPQIITAIRQQILASGGQFLFEKKLTKLILENDLVRAVETADGDKFMGDAVILATGHSARDIFEMLHTQKILIESKPFALGVRIEHPQVLIDQIQYHCTLRDQHLPPASYGLVEQVQERGVFSFCMCPGGIIAPAATNKNEIVVNGWSPSKRNNPFANSGMVVQVAVADAIRYFKKHPIPALPADTDLEKNPLLLMHFQAAIEQACFVAGGGNLVAPAQRMVDFVQNKVSTNLPHNSYLPGILSSNLATVLPPFIFQSLQGGFKAFGKKMPGYLTNDAVVVATESRTSSPVRIPRNAETLAHPQISNLYPCGEGAGYAGGIVSAAMDGEKIARMLATK